MLYPTVRYLCGFFSLDSFISESLELSLALANRSACLHRARFYRRAVQDVELAIRCGYPR